MKGMSKMAVPIGVVAIVLMLVVPLPAAMLALLLGLNIPCSLLILLVSMQIKRPLDFAVFPSLILIATLFRLSLNVSSTRLVLTDGYAGKVIEAFGHFVIGGSLVVGLVIFVILTITEVERSGSGYGGLGIEGQPGLSAESVNEFGAVLDALEQPLGGCGELIHRAGE